MFYGALLSRKYTAWVTPRSAHLDPRVLRGASFLGHTRQPFKDVASGGYMNRVNSYNVHEQWVLGTFDGDRAFPSFAVPKAEAVDRLWKPINKANPTVKNGGLGLNREQFFAQWFEPPKQLCGRGETPTGGTILVRCRYVGNP